MTINSPKRKILPCVVATRSHPLNYVDSLCTTPSRTAVLLKAGCYVFIYLDDNPSGIAVEVQRDWALARRMSFFEHPFRRLQDNVGANEPVKLAKYSGYHLMLCSPLGPVRSQPKFLNYAYH